MKAPIALIGNPSRARTYLRAAVRKARLRFERLLLPASGNPARHTDFRRVVSLVAALAVGFFLPSLPMAGVPIELWPGFLVVATLAGAIIAGSLFVAPRSALLLIGIAALDAFVVGWLGWLFGGYYHQIGLVFMLVVIAHAVVHGLRASMTVALLGAIIVPTLIEPAGANPTDPVYALIYLSGAALVPWTAARLADRRFHALQRHLAATRAAQREAVLILARAAEAKDEVTGDHVARVGDLSARLAERAGMDVATITDLRFAAMLHDVGKLHVPDRILLKPGPLDREEWAIIRQHTIWGQRILGSTAGFTLARTIARSHHENWDGSGYPDGLMGDGIPLAARIVRLADVFDALSNRRPYKEPWSIERCLDELARGTGKDFDPELAPLFIALLESHVPATAPVGAVPAAPGGGLVVVPVRPPRGSKTLAA